MVAVVWWKVIMQWDNIIIYDRHVFYENNDDVFGPFNAEKYALKTSKKSLKKHTNKSHSGRSLSFRIAWLPEIQNKIHIMICGISMVCAKTTPVTN